MTHILMDAGIETKILGYLQNLHDWSHVSEIAKEIDHNRITVAKYLQVLKAKNKLETKTLGKAKLWRVPKREKKKILIVDDEPHINNLLQMSLQKEDRALFTAMNGKSALAIVEKEIPDIIILDLMLPDISGFEVCQKIKSSPGFSHIPILILSAKTQPADRARAMDAGANEYIFKPFDPFTFEKRVADMLESAQISLFVVPRDRQEKFEKVNIIEIQNLDGYIAHFGKRKAKEMLLFFSKTLQKECDQVLQPKENVFSLHGNIKKVKSAVESIKPYFSSEDFSLDVEIR